MTAFFALLKLSFKNALITTAGLSRRKNKKKASSGVGAIIFLSVLMLYMSGTYSFSLASSFAPLAGLDVMLMLMIALATVFPLTFVLFAAQGLVFSTQDMDSMLSLPVSAFTIMLAKVLALYLEALLLCQLMLLPAGAAYYINGGSLGVLMLLSLFVLGFFLAFFSTTVSLLLGCIVSVLISRSRFKNLLNVLFSLAIMLGVAALSFGFSFTMSSSAVGGFDVNGLRTAITTAMPPLFWAYRAAAGSPLYFLLIVAVCLLPFLLVCWLFSLFYKKILTALASTRAKNDYKLKEVKVSGYFAALVKKEAGRFFRTPAYVLNCGFGILIAIAACVAAVVFRQQIAGFMAVIAPSSFGAMFSSLLPPIILAMLFFMASPVSLTCVSISLEGKTLWILKAAPISTGKIFAAKAFLNILLNLVVYVVCIPLLGIGFALPPAHTAAMLCLALLYAPLTALVGLVANLLLPRMDSDNEAAVIKQSASTIVDMLLNLAILAILAGLFFLFYTLGIGFLPFCGAAFLLLALLNALVVLWLSRKGARIFAGL